MFVCVDGCVVVVNLVVVMLLGVLQSVFVGSGVMLFDLKDVLYLCLLFEMLCQWLCCKSCLVDGIGDDDVLCIFDLLFMVMGGWGGCVMLSVWLCLCFILLSLVNLCSVYMDSFVSLIGLGLGLLGEGGEMCLCILLVEVIVQGWLVDDEVFLCYELYDIVLVYVESWECVVEQVQQEKLVLMGWLVVSVVYQICNLLVVISQVVEFLDDLGEGGDGQDGGVYV